MNALHTLFAQLDSLALLNLAADLDQTREALQADARNLPMAEQMQLVLSDEWDTARQLACYIRKAVSAGQIAHIADTDHAYEGHGY